MAKWKSGPVWECLPLHQNLSVCCALCLARAQAQALLYDATFLPSGPPAPPLLFNKQAQSGSHSAHRLFEIANTLMAGELAGTQTLHVTDFEFAMLKLHDSFIAAQVTDTRIHCDSSHFSEPIACVL